MKNIIKMIRTFKRRQLGNPNSPDSRNNPKSPNKRGFSLVELLIVIVIIGILSVVSFVAIQRAKSKAFNERALDDLIAISNALEDYQRDHPGEYPLPAPDSNQNVLCYNIDATYTHDCATAAFRQGMIDNSLLTKRYLREVPTDPRTGSRYVYGVTNNQKYFQIAGIYEREDGTFEARTVENLIRGYELPSLIRAFDSPNFVMDKETCLPYSPDHLVLSATLDNISGQVTVNPGEPEEEMGTNGMVLWEDDKIATGIGSADLYFSDGSITHLDPDSDLELKHLKVDKNDSEGTITKILLKLNAGKIWSKVVRLAEKSEFRVETTGAIAGVRGTEFGVDLDLPNPFIFKSGEVWKMDKADEDMGGQEDAPVEDIMDIETPEDPNDESYDAVDPADLGDYEEYYTNIPLHSGIQPHILSVMGGEIIVRNVNYFVELVDEELGLLTGRNIQASHLAAYTVSDAYSEHPYPLSPPTEITTGADPHIITVPTELGEAILLRFEYHEAGELVRASGFSAVELQITSDTSLNEDDIYADPATQEGYAPEEYMLEVIAEPFFPLPENADETSQFQLQIDVNPAPGPATYQITSADTQVCEQTDPDFTLVNAKQIGLCTLTVIAELETGEMLMETVDVQIIEETSQLVLLFPMEADELIVIGEDTMPVNFEWDAFNEPEGVTFDLYLDDLDVPIMTDIQGHNYQPDDSVYKGDHVWYLAMKDANGNDMETTPESSFTITRMESGGADFTIMNADPNGPQPDGDGNLVVNTEPVTLDLSVDFPDGFTYSWSGSLPLDDTTDLGYSISSYPLPLSQDAPSAFSVILEVVTDDGNVVDSSNQTVTLIYEPAICGNNEIEGDEVCDYGENNSDAYNSPCRTDCSGPGPHCGDGIVQDNDGEECDGIEFGGITCEDYEGPGATGELQCIEECTLIDYSLCVAGGPSFEELCMQENGEFYENACWFVATSDTESCDDVCTGNTFTCSTDPDWTVSSDLCAALDNNAGYTLDGAQLAADYAPVLYIGNNACKNDTDDIRDCSLPGTGPYKRICKCAQ